MKPDPATHPLPPDPDVWLLELAIFLFSLCLANTMLDLLRAFLHSL